MTRIFIFCTLSISFFIFTSCAGDGAKCGDNIAQGSEECDDGNTISGDGCSYNCKLEAFCGNGVCESEETHTCPQDCNVCGNGICNSTESVSSCFPDCYCGNGSCDIGEDSSICASDCQNMLQCGDGVCETGETTTTCLQDCYCLNNTCDEGENEGTCPQDCHGAVCGNGMCEAGESAANCASDCNETVCGDGVCEGSETESSCPSDCAVSNNCGNGNIDSGEECDSSNLNGQTCISRGFDGGTLLCNSNCSFNESGCTQSSSCDIYTQTGCGTGEKCTIDTSTSNRCNTAGTGNDADICNADADCAAGLTCSGLAHNSFGICRRICYDKTSNYDQIHCTGSAGSICNYDVVGGDNLVVPDAHLCTSPCDPVNATGCPSGLNCDIFDANRGQGTFYFTECYETNDPTFYCGSSACSPGYTCINDGYGASCIKLCSTQNTACPASMVCKDFTLLTGTHVLIGSVEYGYCDYQ